jgi:hypothetical protein
MKKFLLFLASLWLAASASGATVTHRVSTAVTTNATSYTSGAFTPTANDLIGVFATVTGQVNACRMTDTQSLGMTMVRRATKASSVDTAYLFVAKALAAASSTTVTISCVGGATPSGSVLQVFTISGMTRLGSAAILQVGHVENQAAAGTPAITFANAVLTGNPVLGLVSNATNPATMTPPSTFTENNDTGYATPTTGAEYVSVNSGFTSATVTWGGTSASAFSAIAAEFDTSSAPSSPSAPALIQSTQQVVIQSGSAITAQFGGLNFRYNLPNPSLGGNAVVCAMKWSATSNRTLIVSDSHSNYWMPAVFSSDANENVQFLVALNVAANTQQIDFVFSAGPPNGVSGICAEFKNVATVAALDGVATGTGTSTAVATGATSSLLANSLVIQYGINDNTGNTTSVTAGTSPWALGGVDRMNPGESQFWQWKVLATATSDTPSMTIAPSSTFNAAAIVLRGQTTGNDLSAGIKVLNVGSSATDNATGRASPLTDQFPGDSACNLLVGSWVGASGDLTAVSDDVNGSWTSAGGSVILGASGTSHIYYKAGATCTTTMVITLTTTAATSLGDTFVAYSVKGAATSPFDLLATATGTQVTSAGNFNIVAITPTTANGLVIVNVGVASNNLDPVTLTPGYWDPADENDEWGHYYNPDTSAIQFAVTSTIGAVGNWASSAAAFKAPAAGGGGPPHQLPTMGCCAMTRR